MSEGLTRSMYADGGDDQASFRNRAVWYDQHDREWVGMVEKRSGHPTGNLSLQQKTPSGNRTPWEPDQAYLTLDPNDPTAINIDYGTMLADRLEARETWNKAGVDAASGRSWDIPESKDEYGYFPFEERVIAIIGKAPRSWVPVKAAMDGNKWILGFTDTVDERIAPFVAKATKTQILTSGLPSFATEGESPARTTQAPRSRAAQVRARQALQKSGEAA